MHVSSQNRLVRTRAFTVAIALCGLAGCTVEAGSEVEGPSRNEVGLSLQEIKAAGYVVTPFAAVHKSCVHEVPSGAEVVKDERARRHRILLKGKEVARYPFCERANMPLPGRSDDNVTPDVDGWVASSRAVASENQYGFDWFNKIQGEWTVPANPTSSGEAVIFLFNGFGKTSGLPAILQPVLSWGDVGWFSSGHYWSIASWYYHRTDGTFFSSPARVSAGNVIRGTTTASRCNNSGNCTWNIEARQLVGSPGWSTSLYTSIPQDRYNVAYQGVLEAQDVTSCDQFPNAAYTQFSNTYLYMPGPRTTDFNEVATQQSWSRDVRSYTPDCGWSVTNFSRGTSLWY